ncbi:MAG: slipin family protein [Phycisphaerae bacterium]|nr:slipin family protein [Phycisphaerae bacterium]
MKGSPNVVTVIILVATGLIAWGLGYGLGAPPWLVGLIIVAGVLLSCSPRVIREWERGVLLRLGKFRRVLDPGVAWVIPGIEQATSVVDMRIRSTSFSAEKTLTRDTVPVDVDAVLFWVVTDAKRSVLEVKEYQSTTTWAAQTTLRDVIGRTELVRMISDREGLDKELQTAIDAKTSEWGITVQSVEIRDVRIPAALEDAMSRKAQAEREKLARVILAESEVLVAEEIAKAAGVYEQKAHAMQLRAMNMTYESIKERGALMVIPSGMADSMNTGVIGLAAMGFRNPAPTKEAESP